MDELNSRNHKRQRGDPEVGASFPPELKSLAERLSADGAEWQNRLPDPARAVERIRAIPYESLLPLSEGAFPMSEDPNTAPEVRRSALPRPTRPASFMQRMSNLVAVAVLLALVGGMALVFYEVRHGNNTTGGAPTTTSTVGPAGVLRVTSVSMSVAPASIAGLACGTATTVNYTALFHFTPNNGGGTVNFTYTVNNGRGETPASFTVAPGVTSKSYVFTWSGALPVDHTYPQPGGVAVTSPNSLISALVAPTGQCAVATAPACGSNFSSPISQNYQTTLTTDYGTVPLPSLSRTVPNNASGGLRGFDICSAGTAASVTSFLQQNLPAYGWSFVGGNGDTETWKSGKGVINWSVSDPLDWNINWHTAG